MITTSKRLISILICLTLVLAMLPMAVSAAGTTIYVQPNDNWNKDGARFAAYFFGNGETWLDCTDPDGDGIYQVDVPDGYNKVIFCRMNPNASANNWSNKWNQTSDLDVPTDNKVVYVVTGWDKGPGQWIAMGGEVEPVETAYYLVGSMNGWSASDSNKMTKNADGTYSITMDLAATTYEYKITDSSGNWSPDPNMKVTVSSDCAVTFTLTLGADLASSTVDVTGSGIGGGNTPDPDPVETIYYIAGSMNGWTASDAGKMTKNGDVYTLVLSLDAGNYTFKTTDSNGAWYPEGMGNDLSVYLVSACDVTFTFDPATGETTATGSGIGEPTPVVYDYYVAGSAGLCGVEWDCAAEANKMEQVGDVYIKTYAGVIAGSYSLKVTNGSWDQSWGGLGENGNYDITVTTLSDVTVTFDGSNVSVDVVPVAYQPTVKYQVTNGATAADATTNVRFLTAVDSLDYSSVVFTLSIAGNEGVPYACETVYEQLVAGDVTYESAAAIFGEGAAYFVAFTLENVPQEYYNETISVSVVLTAKDGSQTTVTRDIVVADALA